MLINDLHGLRLSSLHQKLELLIGVRHGLNFHVEVRNPGNCFFVDFKHFVDVLDVDSNPLVCALDFQK